MADLPDQIRTPAAAGLSAADPRAIRRGRRSATRAGTADSYPRRATGNRATVTAQRGARTRRTVADPYPQPDYGSQQPAYGATARVYGQQPAYGVNPYQQPVYGYVPPNHPQATTALILGIVGLALCPFVGIAGFVMGGRVRREIDAAPGQWGGRGLATAGWVLGIISIVYAALVLAYIVGIAVVAVASS